MYACVCAHVCEVAGMEKYNRNTDGLRERALSPHTFHLPHWTISRVITPEVIQEKKTDVTRSFLGPLAQASRVGRDKAGTGSQGKMISHRPYFLLPEKTQKRLFFSSPGLGSQGPISVQTLSWKLVGAFMALGLL